MIGVQGGLLSNLFEPVYIATITIGRKYSAKTAQRGLCCRSNSFAFTPPQASIHAYSCSSRSSRSGGTGSGGVYGVRSGGGSGDVRSGGGSGDASGELMCGACDSTMPSIPAVGIQQDRQKEEICLHISAVVVPSYRVNHPAMLCTAVKFDEGCITTSTSPSPLAAASPPASTPTPPSISTICVQSASVQTNSMQPTSIRLGLGQLDNTPAVPVGAQFDESRCLAWWYGFDSHTERNLFYTNNIESSELDMHIIDGNTGLAVNNSDLSFISELSSSALYTRYIHAISLLQSLPTTHSATTTMPTHIQHCAIVAYLILYISVQSRRVYIATYTVSIKRSGCRICRQLCVSSRLRQCGWIRGGSSGTYICQLCEQPIEAVWVDKGRFFGTYICQLCEQPIEAVCVDKGRLFRD